jgi:hypothetical protein
MTWCTDESECLRLEITRRRRRSNDSQGRSSRYFRSWYSWLVVSGHRRSFRERQVRAGINPSNNLRDDRAEHVLKRHHAGRLHMCVAKRGSCANDKRMDEGREVRGRAHNVGGRRPCPSSGSQSFRANLRNRCLPAVLLHDMSGGERGYRMHVYADGGAGT